MNIIVVTVGLKIYVVLVTTVLGNYPTGLSFYGIGWFEFALLTFANFRHSELWISFGPLNYLISSPAMHQIHHSLDERHRDKNFGH
jgi:sterol desaturase/sphingolipid hydroxylase (fatty acid hydroxylase superfamily)